MKTLLAVGAMLLMVCQARAEKWPEHGYYQVEDGSDHGRRFCRLRAELKVHNAIFAFVLQENFSGSLLVQFLAQSSILTQADLARIAIDDKEIFRFIPQIRDDSTELQSVAATITDGGKIVENMRRAALNAKWLQVIAAPYKQAVPAEGLRDALEDLVACRTRVGT